MIIWTQAYRPFRMGGDVNQPIGVDVEVTEPIDVGCGMSVYAVVAPDGRMAIAEATSGAIVGQSLAQVRQDVAAGDPEVMAEQVASAHAMLTHVGVLDPEEFFDAWRTGGERAVSDQLQMCPLCGSECFLDSHTPASDHPELTVERWECKECNWFGEEQPSMPGELQPGPASDARVCEWIGLRRAPGGTGVGPDEYYELGDVIYRVVDGTLRPFQPTTNAAHAGEARRRADWWGIGIGQQEGELGVECSIRVDGGTVYGFASLSETADAPDPEAAAEALATARAIDAALKAKEKACDL